MQQGAREWLEGRIRAVRAAFGLPRLLASGLGLSLLWMGLWSLNRQRFGGLGWLSYDYLACLLGSFLSAVFFSWLAGLLLRAFTAYLRTAMQRAGSVMAVLDGAPDAGALRAGLLAQAEGGAAPASFERSFLNYCQRWPQTARKLGFPPFPVSVAALQLIELLLDLLLICLLFLSAVQHALALTQLEAVFAGGIALGPLSLAAMIQLNLLRIALARSAPQLALAELLLGESAEQPRA